MALGAVLQFALKLEVVMFVAVFAVGEGGGAGVVQVLEVVVHAPHVGPEQVETLACVMEPVCPAGHESVCVWAGRGVQVGVAQVLLVVTQSLQVGDVAPAAQLEVRVCVIAPICPAGHESVCVCGEVGSGVQIGAAFFVSGSISHLSYW